MGHEVLDQEAVLQGHEDSVFAIAFSPDGTTLASAGTDDKLILWDIPSGRELGEPLSGHGIVWDLALGRDGDTIATANNDGSNWIWSPLPLTATTRAVATRICAVVGANLSRNDWRQFIPAEPYLRTCPTRQQVTVT